MTEQELLLRVALLCALTEKEGQKTDKDKDWQLEECLNGRR